MTTEIHKQMLLAINEGHDEIVQLLLTYYHENVLADTQHIENMTRSNTGKCQSKARKASTICNSHKEKNKNQFQ